VNKPNGTPCPSGKCNNGSCVACLPGETQKCNPQCGVFDSLNEGTQECSGNSWASCKPVICGPQIYQFAPKDSNWHCNYVAQWDIYRCLKIYTSWICGVEFYEIRLKKASDANGSADAGTWTYDLKVVLRNTGTGKTWTQSKVQCQGNSDAQGGCFFDVGALELKNLGVTGLSNLEVDIYSPFDSNNLTGTTGKAGIYKCW